MASTDIWKSFSVAWINGEFDRGCNFYINNDRTESSWYPTAPGINDTYMFSVTDGNKCQYVYFCPTGLAFNQSSGTTWPIRCMKLARIDNTPGGGEGYTGDEYEW